MNEHLSTGTLLTLGAASLATSWYMGFLTVLGAAFGLLAAILLLSGVAAALRRRD